MNVNFEALLTINLQQMGIELAVEPLVQYLNLLHKWNSVYNLTSVRDMQIMVVRHILDSLAVLPWVNGNRLLDVGSGAGLPGIPLALALPQRHVVLLDSNGKKTRFLQEVKRQLKLENIEIVQNRVETYRPTQGFDTVMSRAFSDLNQMIHWTQHLLNSPGLWLAMKGRYPQTELANLQRPYRVQTYTVPGLNEDRCCVLIDK